VALALKLGGKVLPHLPISLEDVAVELQGPGLDLHLQQATATFEPGPDQQLQMTLMAHHFGLRAAAATEVESSSGSGVATAEAAETPGQQQQQQQRRPGITCPAIKIVCAVGSNSGLLPVAITLVDVRVGEILVSSPTHLMLAMAQAGSSSGGSRKQAALANGAAAAPPKPAKPSPDVIRLLQLLPTKAKVSLAGVRFEDDGGSSGGVVSSGGVDSSSGIGAGLPALTGHIGPLHVSLSSAPSQLLRTSAGRAAGGETAGKVAVAAVSLGAIQLRAAVRGDAAAAPAAAAACSFSVDNLTAALELSREFAAPTAGREARQQQRIVLQGSATVDAHAPKVLVREGMLPPLLASLRELSARIKAAKAVKQARITARLYSRQPSADPHHHHHQQQQQQAGGGGAPPSMRTLARDGSADNGYLLPSPASSVASVSAFSAAAAAGCDDSRSGTPTSAAPPDAAARPQGVDGGSGTAGFGEGQQDAESASAADAGGRVVELKWQGKLVNHGSISVEVADGESQIAHWLCLQTLEGSAGGSVATAGGGPPTLQASVVAKQLGLRCRPAAEAAVGAQLQQLIALDGAELCVSSAEDASAGARQTAAAAAAVGGGGGGATTAPQPVPLLLSVSAGSLTVAASQQALEPIVSLAISLAAIQSSSRRSSKSKAAAGEGAAAAAAAPGKVRKLKAFKLASVGAALQSLNVAYTAPLVVLPTYSVATEAGAVAGAKPPCDPVAAVTAIELAGAGLQFSGQLGPQKLLLASLQLLTIDSRTLDARTAPAGLPLQSCRLLQLGALEARLHDQPAMQLVKIACGQLHSHTHIDAVIAPLGAVISLLQLAGAAKQRAAKAAAADAQQQQQQQQQLPPLPVSTSGAVSSASPTPRPPPRPPPRPR